jgi:hypothetical protein
LKLTAPWESIEDWDSTSNAYDHLSGSAHGGCVWVNIAAGRRMCVAVQVEWHSNADRAVENFTAYRKNGDYFQTFINRRVNPSIDGALTSIFADFDPLSGVTKDNPNVSSPDFNKLYKDKLIQAINAAIGEDIVIRSISFGAATYDDKTNGTIAAYGLKVLEARNLAVDEANAAVRKRIAATSGVTPAQQQCMDIAKDNGTNPGACINTGGVIVSSK